MDTNKTFLEYVSEDIIDKWGTDLSRTAVVFPNKRAALFMNEYLARYAGQPMWSPAYITISDLFRRHSDVAVGDSIKLICDLHKSFVKCTGINETLDHFYGWGQLLLTDFDDIDKNMADADKIFCNLKDIHELDDISYLSDSQRETLKRFFTNFNDHQDTELKQRFISLWSHFGDIYHDYNSRLKLQGLGYEGAVYREVATKKDIRFKYDRYLFVGFNLLQQVEQRLFARLKADGKAHFYWDFDNYYMPHGKSAAGTEAGHYIDMYLRDFPNEIDIHSHEVYDNMRAPKDIAYIAASTENIQARYLSTWLREGERYKDGRKTAVVMCDESILLPVMHCLPPEADKVNITSGFPLGMTPIASLISQLTDMYTTGSRQRGQRYRTQYATKVLTHPYARYISDNAMEVASRLRAGHIFYPDRPTLTCNDSDEGLALLFPKDANFGETAPSATSGPKNPGNIRLLQQMSAIIRHIGTNIKNEGDALMQESVFRMYTIVNRLGQLAEDGDMDVDITTLRRLMSQLVTTTAIPFHGEPVVGIQIMGVLETRNLDFDHLLLLSCNEGNMPKGVNDASFIPYSIRKAYGLTTIDNKVAIYSYYFHRLLQRAKDITIAYNSATDNGHTGEMSRFMLQLMVNGTHTIKHYSAIAPNAPATHTTKEIAKDGEISAALDRMDSLSPSAINKYIRCQTAFFYQYVAHIKEPDQEDDTVDNRMFGNIFHKSAQLIYEDMAGRGGTVEKTMIQKYLQEKRLAEAVVDRAFNEELFKTTTGAPNNTSTYNGLQIINRKVIIEYLRQLLRIDQRLAPFDILALEGEAYSDIIFETDCNKQRRLRIGGIIDRLDMVADRDTGRKTIRVIDYKTGHQATMKIKSVEEIFDGTNISQKHTDYYLQTMLYSMIVAKSARLNPGGHSVSPALLFIKQAGNAEYDPTLEIDSHPIADVNIYKDEFISKLKELLGEIFSHSKPFVPTSDKTRCETCPYKKICNV